MTFTKHNRTQPSSAYNDTLEPRSRPRPLKILPPLSALTYYRRNITRTLPIGGAIVISVFLVAAIVTLLNSVDQSIATNYGFVQRFSVVASNLERDISPALRERLAALRTGKNAPLGRMLSATPYLVPLRTIFGEMPVPVYGIEPDQMPMLAGILKTRLVEGRWPRRNQAEVVMSRAWANAFQTRVGGYITPGNERLPSLPQKQKLVGILDGGENIALTDRTYLLLELPEAVQRTSYLLIPKNPQSLHSLNVRVQAFLTQPTKWKLSGDDVRFSRLYTYKGLVEELRKSLGFLFKFLAIADGLVIGAVALMAGFLANIYFEQRLSEFGLLSAFGFRRERLARRVVVETGSLVLAGWLFGLAMTWLLFRLFDKYYMEPRGLVLARINFLALQYTLPTPIIVGIASLATVLLRLYRTDPIEIMERR
ncbi:MAG TPA: ABC transporter permease [Abditibacteriaceae bacterium]|jgi:hypothetical protein